MSKMEDQPISQNGLDAPGASDSQLSIVRPNTDFDVNRRFFTLGEHLPHKVAKLNNTDCAADDLVQPVQLQTMEKKHV